jgi:hypothetical protein
MHLPSLLDQLSATEQQVALPVEFVLLDLEAE